MTIHSQLTGPRALALTAITVAALTACGGGTTSLAAETAGPGAFDSQLAFDNKNYTTITVTLDGVITWTQETKLDVSQVADVQHFANVMAISPDGSTLVVGADQARNGVAQASGTVLVYTWNATTGSWVEAAKLYAPDVAASGAGAGFGRAVAIDANKTILVGAPLDSTRGEGAGAAYVFTPTSLGGWAFQKKLLAADAQPGDWFGSSVAVDGASALIGSGGNPFASGDRAAYFFERGGPVWSETVAVQQVVNASGGWGRQGLAVALAGNNAVITVPDAGRVGEAQVFARVTTSSASPRM